MTQGRAVWWWRLQAAALRLLTRLAPSEQSRLLGLTVVAGAVCGLVAVTFHLAIRFVERQSLERAYGASALGAVVGLVLLPALGAGLVGWVTRDLPAVRGSGIPFVKAVYSGALAERMRLRDGVLKFVLTSVQVGTGSSLGREGPTVQICSTVAAVLGRALALSPSNQRRLIPVGSAAGVAAAFNAPVAAVTFVIEELVGELDTTVLSGVVVAAAVAAVVERAVLGGHPIFDAPAGLGLAHTSSLATFALLGVCAGFAGHGFSRTLIGLRGAFARSTLPTWLRPVIGALVTGAVAALVFTVFGAKGVAGPGYHAVEDALWGRLSTRILVVLCIAKFASTITSYSSGGVGGVFAPTLFVGSMLGGVFGDLDAWVFGHDASTLGAFALVGMGCFFAAVVRAPMTSVLIIFEMTGSYGLILPLMIANMIAFVISRRLGRRPLYEALLEQDGVRLPQLARSEPVLSAQRVRSAMTTNVVALDASTPIRDALRAATSAGFVSFPVRDAEGAFLGVMTEAKLRQLASTGQGDTTVGEHVRVREYLHEDCTLREAITAMTRLGVHQMAVVVASDRTKLAGILTMSDVMRALLVFEAPTSRRADGTPLPWVRADLTPLSARDRAG